MSAEPEREFRRSLGSLKPALGFLRPYGWQILGAAIALVITASVTLSIGQGLRLVIDEGFGAGLHVTEGQAVPDTDLLVRSLAVFAGLVLVLTAGTYVRFYLVSWVGERVAADIRRAVFDRLITLHPGFFEANLPTEIQSRLTTDTTLLQTVVGSSVSVALRNLLMFIGGLILLVISNPKLTLVVVAGAPVVVLCVVWFGRRVRELSRQSQDTVADVGSYVGEAFRHIRIVQAFNHQDHDQRLFAGRVESAFAVAVRRIRHRAFLVAIVMLLVLSAIATMLWVGGQDVLAGRTSPGELAAFIFYAFIVAGSVGAMSEVYGDLQRAAGATERLVELLDAKSPLLEPEMPSHLPADGLLRLDVEDLWFRYPTRPDTPVLHGLSCHVGAGEMVALVGPSGAGKSTLFELILRFYDPERGTIRLDGLALPELSLRELRAQIALVPQEAVLFAGTLAENLRYGEPHASDERLWTALEAAHAAEFVRQLPDGLQTRLGEDGGGLSGGQKQRLAIARALVTQPRLLLLDEATSALDAASEEMIRQTLQSLRGRCTMLVIAHRLSTVVAADRILVLESGRLVADGPHGELMERSPLYREFADIQFNGMSVS